MKAELFVDQRGANNATSPTGRLNLQQEGEGGTAYPYFGCQNRSSNRRSQATGRRLRHHDTGAPRPESVRSGVHEVRFL